MAKKQEQPEPEQSTYTTREQEHYEQIRQMSRACDKLRGEAEAAKSRAASLKKAFEEVNENLRLMIDRGPDLQGKLPGFEQQAWRGMPLSAAGIVGKQGRCLTEAGIDTLGKLAEFTAQGKPLTDINGIGDASAEGIIKLMEQFWIDHPEAVNEQDGEGEASAA